LWWGWEFGGGGGGGGEGGGRIPFLLECLRISLSITSSSKLMNGVGVHRPWDYLIGSNFGKFYLIRTNFTLGEPVSIHSY
jgi:hypothetical protein